MARRRRRAPTKRRTRRNTGFNVKQAAFALGAATIATKGITNLGLWDFLTAGTPLNAMSQAGYANKTSATAITLKEIMAGGSLHASGAPYGGPGIGQLIIDNLQKNAIPMVFGIAGLKVADKLLGKAGVWRNTNKMLDAVGVKSIVRV